MRLYPYGIRVIRFRSMHILLLIEIIEYSFQVSYDLEITESIYLRIATMA
jgi:hypothetical protein